MVNDHYYNDGVEITKEEAHALKDKSKLIVADRVVQKAESDQIVARMMEEQKPKEEVVEEQPQPEEEEEEEEPQEE